jgi:uncharacterized protein (TIGR02266 family)
MAEEKKTRRYLRLPIAVEFRVKDADGAVDGELQFDAVDISAGGAFLRSEYLLEQDDKLEVSFLLPNRPQRINARARVAWVTKSPKLKGEAGMGIEFLDLSEDERAAITAYVREQKSQIATLLN